MLLLILTGHHITIEMSLQSSWVSSMANTGVDLMNSSLEVLHMNAEVSEIFSRFELIGA